MAPTVGTKLSKDTLIPVGLVLGVVIAVSSAAVWLNTKLQSLDYQMSSLQMKIDTIQHHLDVASSDRWTNRDMKLWVQILKAKNPNLEVPKIEK